LLINQGAFPTGFIARDLSGTLLVETMVRWLIAMKNKTVKLALRDLTIYLR
jgi:hypothetical protein